GDAAHDRALARRALQGSGARAVRAARQDSRRHSELRADFEILRRALFVRVRPAHGAPARPQGRRRRAQRMRKVLVIDDHESSRREIVASLKRGGYEVAGEGTSGRSAVSLARAAAPDVLLMAVGLPDMDGIEAARDVMRAQPLPIVLVTSHFDSKTVERAKTAGIRGYLVKPLRAVELTIAHFRDFVSLSAENTTLKETLEARKLIERAKGLLMEQRRMTEEQAYTLIKKTSMNLRKPMADIAQAIILAGGVFQGDKL